MNWITASGGCVRAGLLGVRIRAKAQVQDVHEQSIVQRRPAGKAPDGLLAAQSRVGVAGEVNRIHMVLGESRLTPVGQGVDGMLLIRGDLQSETAAPQQ